jgi:hypothetical protein
MRKPLVSGNDADLPWFHLRQLGSMWIRIRIQLNKSMRIRADPDIDVFCHTKFFGIYLTL